MTLQHIRLHFHPHYFSRHISADLRELFFSVSILEFANATFMLFEPVYLYTLGFTVPQILLYFGAIYLAYTLLVPFGGRCVAHFGVRRGIVAASLSQIVYFTSLYLISYSPWFLIPAVLFMAIQKSLYWPAFHKDFIETSDVDDSSREISFMKSLVLGVNVIGPIFGGLVLAYTSFHLLFVIVILLILVSNIPLFRGPGKIPKEKFSVRHAWGMIVSRQHRRQAVALIGFGEELVDYTLWPLFMFLILGSTASMGLYLGAGTLISALLLLKIGSLMDAQKRSVHAFLSFGSSTLSLSWLARIFVANPVGVFFAHFLGSTVKNFTFVMISTLAYAQARREHPLAYGVFIEQTLAIGKACIAFLLAAVFAYLGFYGAWLFAAGFALLYAIFPLRSR